MQAMLPDGFPFCQLISSIIGNNLMSENGWFRILRGFNMYVEYFVILANAMYKGIYRVFNFFFYFLPLH